MSPARASNDPYFADQWALSRIHAADAWTRATGAGVRIGIVDTGIDAQHEDLAAKVVAATSCVGANDIAAACSGSAQDDQGHGTHVSGIAAAVTGNGKGIAGVAPQAGLVVVKALSSSGSGNLNDVNAGIKWAVDHGARVINLSLESDTSSVTSFPGQSLKEGIDYAWSKGAIPVIAAGNSTPSLFGQTGYDGINAVIVGATGRNDEVAWYSSPLTSAKWALVAPGGDVRDSEGRPSCAGSLGGGCVVSTGWFSGHVNEYADDEGTSMAAPHVSGVLALLLSQGLTPQVAIQRLLSGADHIACGDSCHGRLNAAAAVGADVAPPAPTTTTARPPAGPPATQPAQTPTVAGGSATPVAVAPSTTPTTPLPTVAPTVAPHAGATTPPGPTATTSIGAPARLFRGLGGGSGSAHDLLPAELVSVAALMVVGVEAAIVRTRLRRRDAEV
jgi:serine protease